MPKKDIRPLFEKFWERVAKGSLDECWEWTGNRNIRTGRPYIHVGPQNRLANRVAWELAYGDIPAGMDVLHTCDNIGCMNNVKHLFLGTPLDNSRDMVAKGRSLKGRTWPSTRRHAHAMLTVNQAQHIRRVGTHANRQELAAKFGVSERTIRSVIYGESWVRAGGYE